MELWERVQKALSIQKELYPRHNKPNAKLTTWLKGLVYCSNCGKTLVNSSNGSLQCGAYARGACQVSHGVQVKIIENLVLEQLKETFKSNLDVSIVPKMQDVVASNEYELLHERLNKLDIKEKRIKEAYQDGIDSKEEYKENKHKLEIERQETRERLSNIKTELSSADKQGKTIHKRIENVYTFLTDENIDLETKYKTAHFLINKIVFSKPEKSLTIEYK